MSVPCALPFMAEAPGGPPAPPEHTNVEPPPPPPPATAMMAGIEGSVTAEAPPPVPVLPLRMGDAGAAAQTLMLTSGGRKAEKEKETKPPPQALPPAPLPDVILKLALHPPAGATQSTALPFAAPSEAFSPVPMGSMGWQLERAKASVHTAARRKGKKMECGRADAFMAAAQKKERYTYKNRRAMAMATASAAGWRH